MAHATPRKGILARSSEQGKRQPGARSSTPGTAQHPAASEPAGLLALVEPHVGLLSKAATMIAGRQEDAAAALELALGSALAGEPPEHAEDALTWLLGHFCDAHLALNCKELSWNVAGRVEFATGHANPDAALAGLSDAALMAELAGLPAAERVALVLHDAAGLTQRQVAAIMRVPPEAVPALAGNARRRLFAHLGEQPASA